MSLPRHGDLHRQRRNQAHHRQQIKMNSLRSIRLTEDPTRDLADHTGVAQQIQSRRHNPASSARAVVKAADNTDRRYQIPSTMSLFHGGFDTRPAPRAAVLAKAGP